MIVTQLPLKIEIRSTEVVSKFIVKKAMENMFLCIMDIQRDFTKFPEVLTTIIFKNELAEFRWKKEIAYTLFNDARVIESDEPLLDDINKLLDIYKQIPESDRV